MSYSIDAIKNKINQLSGRNKGGTSDNKDKPKLQWWKPGLGEHQVRFMPYCDKNGQPFQEIAYYDSRLLTDRRFVAGFQFDIDDPVFELLAEMRKDRSKESWMLWRNLQPKERYYAPIIVRGEEDKGVQIWELSPTIVSDIYAILAHPDYRDENLMDPENGYDFTITASPTDKTFNGFPVKSIKPQARRKSSKLSTNAKQADAWIKVIPDLEAYFRVQVKTREECQNILENFLAGNDQVEETEGDVFDKEIKAREKVATEQTPPAVETAKTKKTKKSIDDAFKDL